MWRDLVDIEAFNKVVSKALEEVIKRYKDLKRLEEYSPILVTSETIRRIGEEMKIRLTDDEVEYVAGRVLEKLVKDGLFWSLVRGIIGYEIMVLRWWKPPRQKD